MDLSNQESISKNAAIAELLQASGLLGDSLTVLDKSKNVNSGEEVEIVNASESQILEIEEKDLKQQEVTTRENSGSFSVSTLSIGEVNLGNLCRKENKIFPIIFTYKNFLEEAVEMLNRSDTPETRALLSQAGIQISDEIGDSEEEEVLGVKMDDTDFEEEVINYIWCFLFKFSFLFQHHIKNINFKGNKKQSATDIGEQLDQNVDIYSQSSTSESDTIGSTSGVMAVSASLTNNRPKTMDIFSTALASADINLDNFMEEEDGKWFCNCTKIIIIFRLIFLKFNFTGKEPEQSFNETPGSPKSEETIIAPPSDANEQSFDLGEVTTESNENP